MTEPLLTMTFTGGRYKNGGIDADALKSAIALSKCIAETAAFLWKKENPGKRLPNGFRKQMVNSFRFTIKGIDESVVNIEHNRTIDEGENENN